MLRQVVYSAAPRFAQAPNINELPYVPIARRYRAHILVGGLRDS